MMQRTAYFLCTQDCEDISALQNGSCPIESGRYYECVMEVDESCPDSQTVSLRLQGTQTRVIDMALLQQHARRVLYPITGRAAILRLADKAKASYRLMKRDARGLPSFYEVTEEEVRQLVLKCSFATIAQKEARTAGYALALCFTENNKSRETHSTIYLNVPASSMLRYAARHQWVLYDEYNPEGAVADALFLCTRSIGSAESGDASFRAGGFYDIERMGPADCGSYRLRQTPGGDSYITTKEIVETHFKRVGARVLDKTVATDLLKGPTLAIQQFAEGGDAFLSILQREFACDMISYADRVFLIDDAECANGAFIACFSNSAKGPLDFTFIGDGKSREAVKTKLAAACTTLPYRSQLHEFDDDEPAPRD